MERDHAGGTRSCAIPNFLSRFVSDDVFRNHTLEQIRDRAGGRPSGLLETSYAPLPFRTVPSVQLRS
jgi:hypothetical protein